MAVKNYHALFILNNQKEIKTIVQNYNIASKSLDLTFIIGYLYFFKILLIAILFQYCQVGKVHWGIALVPKVLFSFWGLLLDFDCLVH